MTEDARHDGLLVELYHPDGRWVEVGWLARNGERNWFESAPAYWEDPARPVLGQIFDENGPSWRPTTRVRLPTWFGHVLPEGRLRTAVADAAGVNAQREFFLLSRIGGSDLPGGLRITEAELGQTRGEIDAEVGAGDDELRPPVERSAALKFSLAGVQLKFSLRQGEHGFTVPASNEAGRWIVKLPGTTGFERVTDFEHATLQVARCAGFDVPDAQLVPVASIEGLPAWATRSTGNAIAVKRFDRLGETGRLHFEELAQVLDIPATLEDAKYDRANFETVGALIGELCGDEGTLEVVRRLVFNFLVGNGDAHLKNWAICYPDGRRPSLTEAYDLVPTVAFLPDDDIALNLNRSKRFDDVRLNSFRPLAKRAGLDWDLVQEVVASTVGQVASAWSTFSEYLDPDDVRVLTEHRDRLPLYREIIGFL